MLRMKDIPRYWADCNTTDFSELDAAHTVAVLPLGATEQHGPHLPLSVDTDLVNAMLAAALAHLQPSDPVLLLPTQTVGLSSEHTAYDGTLSFAPSSVIEQWCSLGDSVARTGIKKLLLFNAHGGNVGLMDVVARELRGHCGLTVFGSNWYQLPLGDALKAFDAHEQRFGVHGGDMETSLMLAIAPHKVRMDEAQVFASSSSSGPKTLNSWATAKAPSWAGTCRTTTRMARPATRQQPRLSKAKPCLTPLGCSLPNCCKSSCALSP